MTYLDKCFENKKYLLCTHPNTSRGVWKPKTREVCHVAHTSLLAFQNNQWYFDSGCSRHMTGNITLFKHFILMKSGVVTFGDGKKGRILGKGSIEVQGLPLLKDVFYVEGLKANLISISQICDEGLTVNFLKSKCHVKY